MAGFNFKSPVLAGFVFYKKYYCGKSILKFCIKNEDGLLKQKKPLL